MSTQPPAGAYQVTGSITRDGLPFSDAVVSVEALLPTGTRLLATAPADIRGRYLLAYQPAWGRTGRPMPVQIRVTGRSGQELGHGPVILDPAVEESRDLTVSVSPAQLPALVAAVVAPAEPTEYDRVTTALREMTGLPDGSAVETADVAVLERATGEPARRLLDVGRAHRLAARTGLDAASLYALLRSGDGALLDQDDGQRSRLLAEAAEQGTVDGTVQDRPVTGVQLRRAAATLVLDPDEPGGEHLAELVRTVITDEQRRRPALTAMLGTGPQDDGTGDPADRAETDQAAADAHQLTFAVAVDGLAGGDLNVVARVQNLYRDGRVHTPADLAGWSATDWDDLLGDNSAPAHGLAADGGQAAALAAAWARAYPSAAVIGRAARRPQSPLHRADLLDFFAKHPDLDLTRPGLGVTAAAVPPPIGGHATRETALAFSEAAAEEVSPATHAELLRLQRLFSVTSDPDQLDALLDAPFRSATAIARTGRAAFVRDFAVRVGGTSAAETLYDRADLLACTATALVAAHAGSFDPLDVAAITGPATPTGVRGVAAVPEWTELFGDPATGTDCPPHRSVLSPAAYLVDLLAFVGRLATADGTNALDTLLARRPDLSRLLLSEANTTVEVPTIDLALELVEWLVLSPGGSAPEVPPRTILDDDFPPGTTARPPETAWDWSDTPAPASGSRCLISKPEWVTYRWPDAIAAPVTAGDVVTARVWLDPQQPPTGMMMQWLARRGADFRWHAVRWGTGLPEVLPRVGEMPATGRWVRLQLSCDQIDLAGAMVHGIALGVAGGRAAFDLIVIGPGEHQDDDPVPPVSTLGSARERQAEPQRVLADAYRQAAATVHPWTLPFDLGEARARAALRLLGLDRATLLRSVHPGSAAQRATDPALVGELLRLTDRHRRLLSGDDLGADEAAHWGYHSDRQPDWFTDLVHAPQFLRRTGLSYPEMAAAPGAALCPGLGLAADPRSPDNYPLVVGLSPDDLPRLRRFLRLWRALGWSAGEVERALLALAPQLVDGRLAVTGELLAVLAQVRVAADRLALPPVTVANLLAPRLDTARYGDPAVYAAHGPGAATASPYEKVFCGDPAAAQVFALDADRAEVAKPEPLAELLPLLCAALHATPDEVRAIVAHTWYTGAAPAAEHLRETTATVSTLSVLWRHITLARAMRLPVTDLLDLIMLAGTDPADVHAPQNLGLLLDARDRAAQAGLSVADLRALLGFRDGAAGAPPESAVRKLMGAIGARMRQVAQEHPLAADPDPVTLVAALAAFGCPRPDAVVEALTDVRTFQAPLASWPQPLHLTHRLAGRIRHQPAAGTVEVTGCVTAHDVTELLSASPDGAWQEAVRVLRTQAADLVGDLAALSGSDPVTALLDEGLDVTARLRWTGARVVPQVRRAAAEQAAIDELAGALSADPQRIAVILSALVRPGSPGDEPAVTALIDLGETGADAAAAAVVRRVGKISWLAERLRMDTDELSHALLSGGWTGWVELTALPAASDDGVVDLAGMLRLLDHVALRDAFGVTGAQLVAYYDQASVGEGDPEEYRAASLRTLAELTGRDPAVLQALAGPDGLDLRFPDDFTDERGAARVQRVLTLADRTGVGAPTLVAWARRPLDAGLADEVEQAARARYDAASWPDVVQPVHDQLREQRRDVLVSTVLADPARYGLPAGSAAEDLSDRLLADVQAGVGRPTSRIAAAVGAVQRFVQRCRLGLEGITLDQSDEQAWTAMSRYRIWRQARSIMVHPESWIDPELRLGKTPLFRALEEELLQTELDAASVEQAYQHYLQGLEAIGRLEISALHRQREITAAGRLVQDTLHVVGRTKASPHLYFHRTLALDRMVWSPWERIEVDIDGEHVTLATVNRRLFLFWPQLTARGKDPGSIDELKTPQLPDKRRDVRLAWTDRRQGRWSPKQVSRPDVWVPESIELNALSLRSTATAGELRLELQQYLGSTNLYKYAYQTKNLGIFRLPGNDVGRVIGQQRGNFPPLVLWMPGDTIAWFQYYAADPGQTADPATVPLKVMPAPGDERVVLLSGLGGHTMLFPSQEWGSWTFDLHDPFVVQVPERGFLVVPEDPPATPSLAPVGSVPPAATTAGPQLLSVPAAPAESSAPGAQPVTTVDLLLGTSRSAAAATTTPRYRFGVLYHPYVRLLLRELDRGGVPAVLSRQLQLAPAGFLPGEQVLDFTKLKPAAALVAQPYPVEDLAFEHGAAYADYNWELFFHAPLLIARRLTREQRFEAARTWLQFLFDPTDTSADPAPQRFWQVRPLHTTGGDKPLRDLLKALGSGTDPQTEELRRQILQQIEQWRRNPLDPDVVARLRLSAYQKAVVFAYLDNLLAWGDALMGADEPEQIDQAAQLYTLAAQILGPPPLARVPATGATARSFADLRAHLDTFSDAVVSIEQHLVSWQTDSAGQPAHPVISPSVLLTPALYFDIPANERLLGYWDMVADRLDKVRRGLTLSGQPRPAAALGLAGVAGGGIAGGAGGGVQTAPRHRFPALLRRAQEMCAEVRALGAALLAALEKRDAERLALMRSTHELRMLAAVRDLKQWQADEAARAVEALQRSRELAVARQAYYAGRPYISPGELAHLRHQQAAAALQNAAGQVDVLGAELSLIPQFDVGAEGFGSSPVVKASFGGQQLAGVTQIFSRVLSTAAAAETHAAAISAVLAGYDRRRDDWVFQAQQAGIEAQQAEAQIAAALLRRQIADREVTNHDLQREQAEAVDDYLRGKFTTEQLYGWMVARLAALHSRAYREAMDLARQAEQALRFELADPDARYLLPDYWDSGRRGLLAGEHLAADLRRMDTAYLSHGQRDLEITKHVSLLAVDPAAVISLRHDGVCFVDVPEGLFDLDYPGHYLRRLAGVAISVPCVTGPYSGVNCRLTLVSSSTRTSPVLQDGYPRVGPEDPRFVEHLSAVRSIVTSSGVNDPGGFETGQREQYQPFEGAGACSRWLIEIPATDNALDPSTISDVVLHLRYTARDGGRPLREAASAWVGQVARGRGARLLQATRDVPDGWPAFGAADGGDRHRLRLPLTVDRPGIDPAGTAVTTLDVFLVPAEPQTAAALDAELRAPDGTTLAVPFRTCLAGLPTATLGLDTPAPLGDWELTVDATGWKRAWQRLAVRDVLLVWRFGPLG